MRIKCKYKIKKVEDTKGVIRSRKWKKSWKYNGQTENDKKIKIEYNVPTKDRGWNQVLPIASSSCITRGNRHRIFSRKGTKQMQNITKTEVKQSKEQCTNKFRLWYQVRCYWYRHSLLFLLWLIDWCLTPIFQLYRSVSFMVSDV